MEKEKLREAVRRNYAKIAGGGGQSCCGSASAGLNKTCCGGDYQESSMEACCGKAALNPEQVARKIGYKDEDISSVPEGANLGLGCGNPVALASIKEGEVVLDLGSGAGFDCFLASQKVGAKGKVIGVDMTPEMVQRARENAVKGGYKNVEFRLGEIENLPVADSSVDVVISNCVINLSPDKKRVFEEIYRVLKPGGRIMISDIVLTRDLPTFIRNSLDAYVGCVAGALKKDEYISVIKSAGFKNIREISEDNFGLDCFMGNSDIMNKVRELGITTQQLAEISDNIKSLKVEGIKPA